MRDWSLTRREARILRRLAERYLLRLQELLPTQYGLPKPGQRENFPWVDTRNEIDEVQSAITKLRRIETT
jgi:hypothetical protein